jgi:hypothetical protein
MATKFWMIFGLVFAMVCILAILAKAIVSEFPDDRKWYVLVFVAVIIAWTMAGVILVSSGQS